MLYVQDPDEINFEPQQAAKLRQLGQKRCVQGDGNCYYYAAAHQLGKLAPDSFDTCTQTRNEIGFYLRSNLNLWQTDIEKLVDRRTFDKGPMSTRVYNMTIVNRVEKDKGWADDDIVVAATAVLYQRDIVILYCGASLAVRTQASGISRNGSPVLGFRMYVPWTTLLPWCLEHNLMIIAILYRGDAGPPSLPEGVVVHVPLYDGPGFNGLAHHILVTPVEFTAIVHFESITRTQLPMCLAWGFYHTQVPVDDDRTGSTHSTISCEPREDRVLSWSHVCGSLESHEYGLFRIRPGS
jgi:hypothetical protein